MCRVLLAVGTILAIISWKKPQEAMLSFPLFVISAKF